MYKMGGVTVLIGVLLLILGIALGVIVSPLFFLLGLIGGCLAMAGVRLKLIAVDAQMDRNESPFRSDYF